MNPVIRQTSVFPPTHAAGARCPRPTPPFRRFLRVYPEHSLVLKSRCKSLIDIQSWIDIPVFEGFPTPFACIRWRFSVKYQMLPIGVAVEAARDR